MLAYLSCCSSGAQKLPNRTGLIHSTQAPAPKLPGWLGWRLKKGLMLRSFKPNQVWGLIDACKVQSGTIGLILLSTQSSCTQAKVNAAASTSILDQIDSAFLIQTLLANPILAVGLSVTLIYAIPRLVGITVRYVIVPIICIAVALLIADNPEAVAAFLWQGFDIIRTHPYQTSFAVLLVLGVVLSPYILAAGIVATLVGGYQLLPNEMWRFTPRPFAKLERQLESAQAASKSGISSATNLWKQELADASEQLDELFRPVAQVRDRLFGSAYATKAFIEDESQMMRKNTQEVLSAGSAATSAIKESTNELALLARDATKCMQFPTKQARSACVKDVNMQRQSVR